MGTQNREPHEYSRSTIRNILFCALLSREVRVDGLGAKILQVGS